MKICPRCRRPCLADEDVLNSVSHEDRNTKICSVCGQMEGFVKLGAQVPQSEIFLTQEFQEYLAEKRSKKN